MNGERYRSLLQEKLQPVLREHNCKTFMQDNAPCHRAAIVQEWFEEEQLRVLDWPGNSPDLNPIENLWSLLQDKVALHQPKKMK